MRTTLLCTLTLCGLIVAPAHAGWLDDLQKRLGELQKSPSTASAGVGSTATGALTEEEVVKGLKEALSKGTRQAIAQLGKDGGFLNNLDVRIPPPEELRKVERLLRTLGQDKYADQFIATLNHAAEKAVPEAASLFGDAIARMSVSDAQAILRGPDDAATQYFRKTSEASLKERFLPIVQAATDQAGVTAAYKALLQKAGPTVHLLGVGGTDLDRYVDDKAVDGLFKMVAAEEKRIRQDPLARTTDLLKKVFGSLF
ncbi:MAG TPA: DUF4197 domain-containing protein [Thiobacillaceae bacterium]|nr:DUF4197 domain-containing protein [Thiobacillaceae bacterium]HNU64199.1 DUF4197 domain-containing protein [Thiobacillaceae bacterium]